jgi:hypothetical protein
MADINAEAAGRMRGPAIGLIVAGAIFLLLGLWSLFYWWDHRLPATVGTAEAARMFEALIRVLALVGLAAAALQIYGGLQMLNLRSYGWAKAAAITSLCGLVWAGILGVLLGLPIGIWALVTLNKSENRSAFPRPDDR